MKKYGRKENQEIYCFASGKTIYTTVHGVKKDRKFFRGIVYYEGRVIKVYTALRDEWWGIIF